MPTDNDICRACPTCYGPMVGTSCLVCPAPAPTASLDIPRIKQAFRSLTYQERVSLCDAVGVHFAYLEAVLTQPGSQQSSLTADQFEQLVTLAASRYGKFAQLFAAPVEQPRTTNSYIPCGDCGGCVTGDICSRTP